MDKSKIIIVGNVFVIISSRTLQELKLIEKYRPEALKIKDDDSNTIFTVKTSETASINTLGVNFNGTSYDESKHACITLPIPDGTEDAKEYVTRYVGVALLNLQNVEAKLQAVLDEIEDDLNEIKGSISYATDPGQTQDIMDEIPKDYMFPWESENKMTDTTDAVPDTSLQNVGTVNGVTVQTETREADLND